MKIGVIGASGMAGQKIYKEAVKRGHEAVGIIRNEEAAKKVLGQDAHLLAKDAFALTKDDLSSFDVVVDAFAVTPAKAYLQVDLAAHLVSLLRETEKPRLFFILGAGSLLDSAEKPFVETIRTMPGSDAWIATPINQFKELQFLRNVDNVNWVGVSPSAKFIPGEAHTPVLGKDHLLTASDGTSHTTSGTMGVAILDEIEKPSHIRERFTVSD